jgi:FKBP-type peptidyl-prolyl cis-trans isomerase
MHRTSNLVLAVAALASPGIAACADDDDTTVESIAEDIENAARTAATEAEEAARTAVTEAEEAARTAVTEAEQAIDEAAADAAETAVRNLAAEQGEEQFADAGHPLDDEGLACEASASEGLDSVSVQCTGTTENGEPAELTGETTEFPGASVVELEGTFTGTVDGAEVFNTDVLGG